MNEYFDHGRPTRDNEEALKAPARPLAQADPPEGDSESASKSRVLSAQRMKYSAEVKLIQNKWGDLESIRKSLGLSQRKMCQLLFVDPSAWTRWTREGGEAPPHIYRALSWFLTLQEKHPESSAYHWLQTVARPQIPANEIQAVKSKVEYQIVTQFEDRWRKKEQHLKDLLISNLAAAALWLAVLAGSWLGGG